MTTATKFIVSISLIAGLLVLSSLSVLTAQAHESRVIGQGESQYTLVVGWRVEPAFEDVLNAIDFIPRRTSDEKPINSRDGDIVEVAVEIRLLEEESFTATVLSSAMFQSEPSQVFGTDNRYNAWIKPTHDGTYALHVTGIVSDASDPVAGPVTFDEVFVCGLGTQSETSQFGCIEDPQTFPGGLKDKDGGTRDKHGYRDDDNFDELRPFANTVNPVETFLQP